jgi:acyl carrier protein phosphodiesterase
MNHLAHLYLAGHSAESLIGNLAGDFVRGSLGDRFPPAVADGIRNHRRIDAYTDSHPSVAAFRRILIPEHGHYARVISDVFFDHFLATRWDDYSAEPLDAFLRRVFATMDTRTELLPERLAAIYPHMRDGRWFRSYATLDGIHAALSHLSKRLSRQPHLETATRHLVDSREELERLFVEFFGSLVVSR